MKHDFARLGDLEDSGREIRGREVEHEKETVWNYEQV
jgi:hypothetical protein